MIEKLLALFERLALDPRLTWGRVALWGCVVLMGIGLLDTYEQRATKIPLLFGSQYGWIAGGLCIVIAMIAWSGNAVLRMGEQRIRDLQAQQDDLRSYLERRIAELTTDRDGCKEDLAEVRGRLARAERVLRDNDLDIDPTR